MIDIFMNLLSGWDPLHIADLFLWLIAISFVISLAFVIWKDKSGLISSYAPIILTTLGILGTFLGITIGLVNFDFSTHESIDQSLPSLLGGLKMAFTTSIFGLAASILIRFANAAKTKLKKETPDEISSKDVYEVLKGQREAMDMVRAAIAGDQDASLVTQIQKARADMNDGLKTIERSINGDNEKSVVSHLTHVNENIRNSTDEIKAEFKEFSAQLSEMATKHIIEALSKVISNFNENLNEQFGDNFKQLNQAVEKLVTWQEEYRQQMIDTKSALDSSVEAMKAGAESLESIKNDAQAIPPTMKTLEEVLEVLGTELSDLRNSIESFGQIKDKAEEALPAISQNVEEITALVKQTAEEGNNLHKKFVDDTIYLVDWITAQLKDMGNDVAEQNKKMTEMMRQAADDVQKSASSVQDQGKKVVEDLGNSFKESTTKINEQIREVLETQGQEVGKLSESLRQEMQKANREREEYLNKEINELVKKMDEALQHELNTALQSMADHLGAITRKFTEDYSDLTDKMSEVVNKARRFEQ